jgi:hypothetical protein
MLNAITDYRLLIALITFTVSTHDMARIVLYHSQ